MSNLNKKQSANRRHYEKALLVMQDILKGEIEAFESDDAMEPSQALDNAALQLIKTANALRAVLEIEE